MANKKRYHLILILIIYCSNICIGQKTLTVHFPDSIQEKELAIHYSIHDVLNYFYEPYKDIKKGSDNYFSFTIPDSISTFLAVLPASSDYIWSKSMVFFMREGEYLEVFLDSINNPHFKGDKAKFYDYLFNLKKDGAFYRTSRFIDEFMMDSSGSFYEFVNNKIESEIDSLDKLLKNDVINQDEYKIGKEQTIDEYLYRTALSFRLESKPYFNKIDSLEYIGDLGKIIQKYNSVFRWDISKAEISALMSIGVIPGDFLDLGLDYSNCNYLGYLDPKSQEKQFARDLIAETSVGVVNNEQLEKRRGIYKKTFPNSIYNNILDKLEVLRRKDHFLAYYSEERGFEEYGKLETDNFNPFLNMFFYDQVLLIDFWATWCGPCLKEFTYREDLEMFLKENNIGMLFVSADFAGAYDQWVNVIKKNNLEGMHFFGTNEFIDKLPYFETEKGIPRYILLDKDGSVLIESCELPSSGKLIPQIKEALGR